MSKIRLGPKNLRDAVSRSRFGHEFSLVPVFREINTEKLELFDKNGSCIDLGSFYELVTMGIYGGEIVKTRGMKVWSDKRNKPLEIVIDVLDDRKKRVAEVKSRCYNHFIGLTDDQVEKYQAIEQAWSGFKSYFVFYFHNFKGFEKYDVTKRELFGKLSENTLCSIVFPFSLVLEFHKCRDPCLVTRQDVDSNVGTYSERDRHMTKILASTVKDLFYSPKKIIGFLEGSQDYVINRWLSPEKFSIDGFNVKQFPILIISDTNVS